MSGEAGSWRIVLKSTVADSKDGRKRVAKTLLVRYGLMKVESDSYRFLDDDNRTLYHIPFSSVEYVEQVVALVREKAEEPPREANPIVSISTLPSSTVVVETQEIQGYL